MEKSENNLESSLILNDSHFTTLNDVLESIFVPEAIRGFDVPLNRSDFSEYLNVVDMKFKSVLDFLSQNPIDINNCSQKYKKKVLSNAFVACGQHISPNNWTTELTVEKSWSILNDVLRIFGIDNIYIALTYENCCVFKDVLHKMRPWLLKETWKNFPAAIACYSWILKLVKSPDLSDNLDLVLPTALIITDDFITENKIIGLKCLLHIINNVGKTQLSWYGRDEVILKAIEPLFFQKDVELIEPLTETFVDLVMKKQDQFCEELEWNEFDDPIDTFISNMTGEQRLELRSAYINSLTKIIMARGLGIMVHAPRLLLVIDRYIYEPTSSVGGLMALKSYVDVGWPRMYMYCNSILLTLSKVALGVKTKRFPPECENELQEIFQLLKEICPERTEAFVKNCQECFGEAIELLIGDSFVNSVP